MAPTGLLTEMVALVTGGSKGIGLAIVERFALEGARGAVVDLGSKNDLGFTDWITVQGDVTREADIAAAIEHTVDTFGRLDIVIANAGVVPPWSETATIDLNEWDRVFAVNVRGVIATIKHAAAAMKPSGGSIVATASLNSWKAHPQQCLYTATKHAVLGIVRATALDLGQYGIRVNAIGPGPIATDALRARVQRRADEGGAGVADAFDEMATATALQRIATMEEVASTALFLASDLSSGQTGLLVPVDCGMG